MTIEYLHIKSVRHFPEVNVTFNPGFNFITGPNGCGKTSLLAIISQCLNYNPQYFRFGEDSEYWLDLYEDDIKSRFGMAKGWLKKSIYRNTDIANWMPPPVEKGRISQFSNSAHKYLTLPPLFIGAQRKIIYKQVEDTSRKHSAAEGRIFYTSESLRLLYGETEKEIKQWIINRCCNSEIVRTDEERLNWDHLIGLLSEIGPFDSNFTYVGTGTDREPVFSLYGKECYLEELSSGFQAVLLIIISVLEWIESCLPEGKRNVKEVSGTVLIDELDNHLHPEWQFTVRDGIEALFPKLQFIITTHSPHLLSSAKENEIIKLPGSYRNERYDLAPSKNAYSGWSTDLILKELMGVQSLDNKRYEKLVHACFDNIDKKDLTALKRNFARLESVCHPGDSVLVVIKVRLAGMEACKND